MKQNEELKEQIKFQVQKSEIFQVSSLIVEEVIEKSFDVYMDNWKEELKWLLNIKIPLMEISNDHVLTPKSQKLEESFFEERKEI